MSPEMLVHEAVVRARPARFHADTVRAALTKVQDALGPEAEVIDIAEDAGGGASVFALPGGLALPLGTGRGRLEAALERAAVPEPWSRRWLARAGAMEAEGIETALATVLEEDVDFARFPDVSVWETPIMLIGPPGAGKTSAAARLATRARMRGQDVVLITLDRDKRGGLDQAEQLMTPIGVDVWAARAPAELPSMVARLPAGTLALIDSTGSALCEARAFEPLAAAMRAVAARGMLVHAAGGDTAEASEIAAAACASGLDGWLVTKLDTVRRLGGVAAAAAASGLPLMGATASPWVAEGFAQMDAASLARLLIRPLVAGSQDAIR